MATPPHISQYINVKNILNIYFDYHKVVIYEFLYYTAKLMKPDLTLILKSSMILTLNILT